MMMDFRFLLSLLLFIYFLLVYDFNISTINLSGARTDFKRDAVFKLMDIKNIDIMLFQETHSCQNNEREWRRAFNGEVILSYRSSLSWGRGEGRGRW